MFHDTYNTPDYLLGSELKNQFWINRIAIRFILLVLIAVSTMVAVVIRTGVVAFRLGVALRGVARLCHSDTKKKLKTISPASLLYRKYTLSVIHQFETKV